MLGVNIPAIPASLRRTNQRTVVSLLLKLGSASRADLAKAAGISQPTAGKIISEMLELGVLQTVEESSADGKSGAPRVGRPGQLLRLDEERIRFIAIDLGVDLTKVSFLPIGVKLQDQWEYEFNTPDSAKKWQEQLKLIATTSKVRGLWGVLVSVPGVIDEDNGKVLFSPNTHWLENASLPELVNEIWDIPVLLVQEMRVMALGEMIKHPGQENFFIVDVGQGVGGAVVINGQLFNHPIPLGGELGHTPVPGNTNKCGCGAIGCMETLVSESRLLKTLAQHTGKRSCKWPDLVKHVQQEGIQPWFADVLDSFAGIIAGALNVVGVHTLVMTGLLTELPPVVTEYLFKRIREGAMWARFGTISCQTSPRNRAAGLIAAGLDRLVIPAGDESKLMA